MNFSSAILGHLVGDYLFQNDWLAINKKTNSWVCLLHCLIWTICVCLFAQIGSWVAFVVLLVSHFLQDRTSIVSFYMKTVGQKQFLTGPCAPWSVIVVDNVFHLLVIWFVLRFV